MHKYPKLSTCGLTGIAKVARNAEEERRFRAAPLAVFAVAIPCALALILWGTA
jgi:hypothetical protein